MITNLAEYPRVMQALKIALAVFKNEELRHIKKYGKTGNFSNHLRELKLSQTYVKEFIERNS